MIIWQRPESYSFECRISKFQLKDLQIFDILYVSCQHASQSIEMSQCTIFYIFSIKNLSSEFKNLKYSPTGKYNSTYDCSERRPCGSHSWGIDDFILPRSQWQQKSLSNRCEKLQKWNANSYCCHEQKMRSAYHPAIRFVSFTRSMFSPKELNNLTLKNSQELQEISNENT